VYKAHGSNASWEWVDVIAPCIEVLRNIAREFNDILGSDVGTRHAPPNLSNDIATLMESLEENNVYRVQKGRMLEDDQAVKDVVETGLQILIEGEKNPLHEYNNAFQRLQHRRRMKPVSALSLAQPSAASTESAPLTTATASDLNPDEEEAGVAEEGDVDDEPEPRNSIETETILDDLAEGILEPTLPRLSEEDVALDMDEVLIEMFSDEESESGESEDETSDENETNEGCDED
jgi:hypothetical protein